VPLLSHQLIDNLCKVVAGGTPAYMAPELFQVSGASAMDIDLKATDIWSLGASYLVSSGRKLISHS
jgi:serine/threonine protein kinase